MHGGDHAVSAAADVTTPISRLVSTARTTSALSCSGDGANSPCAFGASASSFEPDVREPEVHTGEQLDRLVFLVGWHVGVRGELISAALRKVGACCPLRHSPGERPSRPRKLGR